MLLQTTEICSLNPVIGKIYNKHLFQLNWNDKNKEKLAGNGSFKNKIVLIWHSACLADITEIFDLLNTESDSNFTKKCFLASAVWPDFVKKYFVECSVTRWQNNFANGGESIKNFSYLINGKKLIPL